MDPRRRIGQSSSEDSPVSLSSSLRADLNLTNQLSAILDQQYNGLVIQELELSEQTSDENVLCKVLSPDSFISTASSFARSQNLQQGLTSAYRVIGFGQCGLVFERPGRNYVVKVAKTYYEDALWNDFKTHFLLRQAFDQEHNKDSNCCITQLFSYVTKSNNAWWDKNLPLFPTVHESFSLPAMALVSQRILPLPKLAREALIRKYCPAEFQAVVASNPTNRDCLARVYLGRRRPTTVPSANFTLRNFNLHLDQMIELNLPVKTFASSMGEALAIIHWSAHVDAYDIEFVLGSEAEFGYTRDVPTTLDLTREQIFAMAPHTDIDSLMVVNFKRRFTRLWIIDFNLCNIWDEDIALQQPDALIAHLVIAFFENDPYYPLPLMENEVDKELWDIFSARYLEKAAQILSGKVSLAGLPRAFIDGCIQRETESLRQGLGHGHRELKQ